MSTESTSQSIFSEFNGPLSVKGASRLHAGGAFLPHMSTDVVDYPMYLQWNRFIWSPGVPLVQVWFQARVPLAQVWLQARVPLVPGLRQVWPPPWLYSLLQ